MTMCLFLLRRKSLVSEEDDDEDEEEGKAALQPDDKFKINKTGIHGGQLTWNAFHHGRGLGPQEKKKIKR